MESEGQGSKVKLFIGFIVAVYWALIWTISLLGLSQARQKYGKPRRKDETILPSLLTTQPSRPNESLSAPTEGVSILRPLSGLDHNLLANLSSSFEQDFPTDQYEVILSVRSIEDQALAVAQEVCSRFPHVQSSIIIGDEPSSGVNPKIANLVRSYAAAKYDIIWVLDSQVQHGRSALQRAMRGMSAAPPIPVPSMLHRKPHGRRVGLAHHCPLAVTPHSTSLGSHIEAIFLGTNHAKMYLAINSLGIDSCVMGKSNLYRKSDLANVPDEFFNVGTEGTRGEQGAIGSIAFSGSIASSRDQSNHSMSNTTTVELTSNGPSRPLARFGIFLAEDNMLALSLWRPPLSLAHVLLDLDVARMTVGDVKSIHDYIKRRIRWIRVRRYMVPAATYVEPFTESIMCTAIVTWTFYNVWAPIYFEGSRGVLSTLFFICHLLLWHLVDFAVLASLQEAGQDLRGGSLPLQVIDFNNASQLRYYRFAWLCREVLAFPIWFTALCGNTVAWRHQKYRILSDARAARIDLNNRVVSSSSDSLWNRLLSPLSITSHRDQNRRKKYERLSDRSDSPLDE